ncbi:hypothetical protein H0H93_010330 [Arthromyces matolae]|nr:hypothetical protein H0H93_010330 [Arthromyces matolae]
MACTALMDQSLQPKYSSLLNEPKSPDIHNLQSWIEDAWNSGKPSLEDVDRAELVDIDLNGRPRGAEIVKDWIVDYFSPKSKLNGPTNLTDVLRGASPIVVTDRMPIILQHQGHSRTIVGYEVMKGGKIKLLTFDPSTKYNNTVREMGLGLSQLPSAPTAQKRPSGSSHTSHPHLKRSRSTKEDVIYVDDEDEIIITESGSDENLTQEERIKRIFGNADKTAKTLQTILQLTRLHTRNLG